MKRQFVVYVVSLAAFLGPFTQTIYTPILPEVRAAFAPSSFLINLTIAIFTFFLAMMQIVYGPLTDRKGRRTVLLGFMQYYSLYNFLVFLPGILTDRYGLSAQEKGTVYLAMSSMIVIGSFLGGRLQGRFPERRIILTTTYLTTASIFFFLLTAWQSLELLVVAIAMFGLFLGLSLPVQTTVLTNVFQANRSTAIGVYNFFRYMGMAFGPMIGSALLAAGGDRLVYAVDDVLFFACALFLTARIARAAKRHSSA
ncbi:MFS transporter [Geobacillus sp. C56-T2]|uniref:MFS transporter n=1 Tax=Geobacillus sp. C56-T2 TaxID=600773 RepID=UPI0011A3961B|nr:MFS transporter [Geobacillus sp. C56-T2]NNV06634.1 MFS transporter [Geobacillus sp. MMMUD3]TWG31665.1 Arabinose efflux permease [Geobacillus sp. C56-T2]